MKTYYKFYRSIVDHELLANDNNAYIVFTKLLARVDWKTGYLITGRFKMSELTNLNPNTVYATLKRLENAKMITQEPNNRFTKITVINWKKYQTDDSSDNNQITTRQQPDNTINKNKRIKEYIIPKNNELIEQMISTWENYLGMKLTARPSQERAARAIIKRVGKEKALGAVKAAISCQSDQYAPHIANIVQLDKKLDSLLVYKRKQNKDLNNNLVVAGLEKPRENTLSDEERLKGRAKLAEIRKSLLKKD